ncbi:MAG: DUF6029 family protein [Polyangiaceae bacterium]|nr:DUF6029 family protein [Polyangiaceae bacterium]
MPPITHHTHRTPTTIIAAALTTALTTTALAFEAGTIAQNPLTIDITETALLNYNFNNRNNTAIDDNWGSWHNRLNAQAQWNHLIFGFRLDSSLFFSTPDPNNLAEDDIANWSSTNATPPPDLYDTTFKYGRDLSNRYRNVAYPSKLYLTYSGPRVEATVGDLYAQFGRGLILSVRKIDELTVDTTIRGGKLSYRLPMPKGSKLRVSGLGGYLNPLRVDEPTGRVLEAPSAWYFAGMPTPFESAYIANPRPTYVPDQLLGVSIEGGPDFAIFGLHGVSLDRPDSCLRTDSSSNCTPFGNQFERGSDKIRNGSFSVSVPNIADHGSFYLEVAAQQQRNKPLPSGFDPSLGSLRTPDDDVNGHAVYGSVSAHTGPFSLTVEGKHYRKFFPLSANIDANGSVNEFSLIQYSAPPTTLPVYVDTEANFFNTCVTGGRGRLDARVSDDWLLYGWVGRYATWGETGTASCDTSRENRNDVWDGAVGFEATFEGRKSHAFAWFGGRDDQLAAPDPIAYPSSVYYREGYIRYDFLKHLARTFYLQVQGNVRNRKNDKSPDSWWEGETYTGVQWNPHLTVAFGYEFLTQEGHPTHYYNGSVHWQIDTDKSLRLFVGQQRGAMRCMSGVCREFAAFEGARAEAVVRF